MIDAWVFRKSLAGVEQVPGEMCFGTGCHCDDLCYCPKRWHTDDPADYRTWPAGRVFATEGIALAHLRDFVLVKASRLRTRARELDRVAARLTPPSP